MFQGYGNRRGYETFKLNLFKDVLQNISQFGILRFAYQTTSIWQTTGSVCLALHIKSLNGKHYPHLRFETFRYPWIKYLFGAPN